MKRYISRQVLCLVVLSAGCGDTNLLPTPTPDSGAPPKDGGATDAGQSHDAGAIDEGIVDAGTPAPACDFPPPTSTPTTPVSRPDLGDVPEADALGPVIEVGSGCNPPPLQNLDDIPDDPVLDDLNPETVAIFEVDRHRLVSKFVTDRAAAQEGLKLWQEIVLRIPSNQLRDLVQFEVSTDTDPVAYFNRRGRVTTQRNGLKLGVSTANFTRNQADVCAPLEPRRGTFDWSLVHEFGHLRGWLDGSWDRFLMTFPDVRGPGDGYPADGSPLLTGDFVTSYAERADGDEDHAESWTTFVMLDELPPQTPNEPLALQKVRWMATQPGLVELRKALRITEPDGGNATVDPAPRRQPPRQPSGGSGGDCDPGTVEDFVVPAEIIGDWVGMLGQIEVRFTFTANDIIEYRDGQMIWGMQCLLSQENKVMWLELRSSGDGLRYNAGICPGAIDIPLDESFLLDPDGGVIYWSRLSRPGAESINDVVLRRVN